MLLLLIAKVQLICGFLYCSSIKTNFVSKFFYARQLHLQNHCPDSVGVGGEDCGGETITFSRLQKLTNLKNGFVYDEIRTLVDGYCQ